ERLLVLIPAKSVLGMAHGEAVKVQLAEETLIAVAVRTAEDEGRPIAFVTTALNDTATTEEGKAGFRRIGRLAQSGKAVDGKIVTEVEGDVLAPELLGAFLVAKVRSLQNRWFGVGQALVVES